MSVALIRRLIAAAAQSRQSWARWPRLKVRADLGAETNLRWLLNKLQPLRLSVFPAVCPWSTIAHRSGANPWRAG